MSEFLTPVGLAHRLVEKTGVSLEIAKNFSNVFFSIVKKQLKKTNIFSVYNFGTFKKTWVETAWGFNPSTGEKIEIPAHYRIKFTPCASVARRINKKYAVLKPRPAPVDSEPVEEIQTSSIPAAMPVVDQKINEEESLLRKAEKLKAQSELEEKLIVQQQEEIEDTNDDIIQDEKEVKKKKPFKLFIIIGLGIALLMLLIAVLLNCCSGKKSKEKQEPEKEPEVSDNIKVKEKPAVETTVQEPVQEPVVEEVPPSDMPSEEMEIDFEEFTVPYGTSYHQIAVEKFENAHLWPYIYSANKSLSPDPDLIVASKNINIPAKPDMEKNKEAICASVLDAYNGYLLMCEKQPDSKRNKERKRLASRVIVSGELLYPGFIKEYSARIMPEYAELAQNIVDHQYR